MDEESLGEFGVCQRNRHDVPIRAGAGPVVNIPYGGPRRSSCLLLEKLLQRLKIEPLLDGVLICW
ncbi:hypothetical protein L1080_010105 [Rhodococcus sp. MSC1_016]|uniref:hypothetical protein n=1 Tax=Rhodococcus sp. MSC1_016 TaxID=2909266 RepID=UPI00202E639A|nr:hypothetical protein [Rhodococcus sp. MSC1_016]